MMKKFHAILSVGVILIGGIMMLALFQSPGPKFQKADHEKHPKWAPDFVHAGALTDDNISESSGLAASRQYPNLLWTHNDSGNTPILFASDFAGNAIARISVAAPNKDWEDIFIDKDNNFYIADTGNNKDKRALLEIYRFKEPDPKKETSVKIEKIYFLRCPPDFNGESFFVFKDHGYLFNKDKSAQPAHFFRFPLSADAAIDLQDLGTVNITSPITAATLSADEKHLAILSLDGLRVFNFTETVEKTLAQKPKFFPIDRKQIEGCAFTPEGILVSAETGQLILLPASKYDKQ